MVNPGSDGPSCLPYIRNGRPNLLKLTNQICLTGTTKVQEKALRDKWAEAAALEASKDEQFNKPDARRENGRIIREKCELWFCIYPLTDWLAIWKSAAKWERRDVERVRKDFALHYLTADATLNQIYGNLRGDDLARIILTLAHGHGWRPGTPAFPI